MLKRLILFLLIFSLPFQLGYHFWPEESFVKSFRIDYLSPTIYLTDIFIALFLLLSLKEILCFLTNRKNRRVLVIYALLIGLNLIASSFSLVTLIAWTKITAYLLLFVLLSQTPNLPSKVFLPFTLSLAIVIFLAVAQFFRQSSLGGVFYYFGERPFSAYMPNIAKLDIGSLNLPLLPDILVRPYATFSHPNSLAGYLLVAFLILPLLGHSTRLRWLTLLGFLLTFSKSALLAFLAVFILRLTFTQNLFLSSFISVLPFTYWLIDLPIWLKKSFQSRVELMVATLPVLKNNWLTGVGLRQFIPNLANFLSPSRMSYQTLQPVHNIFLLAFSELGILGISLAGLLLSKLKHIFSNKSLNQLMSLILLTGALDHYWWTLPQNQLIIILALALITNKSQIKK